MLQKFSGWEVGVASAVLLLSATELAGIVMARRQGKTQNLSRFVSHVLLIVLVAIYVALTILWSGPMEGPLTPAIRRAAPTANWTYLLLAWMIGLILTNEVVGHMRARRQGLTRNLTRLANHWVMLILLVVLIGINLAKWEAYMQRLEEGYRRSVEETRPPPGDEIR